MPTLIIALDRSAAADAIDLVDRIGDAVDFYKVGAELFTAAGPDVVRELRARGKRVFLDLKYHDIPNTVASAVRAARALEVDLLTVHASGGEAMLRAAGEAAGDGPAIVAVTLLTSFSASEAARVWNRPVPSATDEVARLAALAADCGLHGVVASPLEIAALRRAHADDFLIVTPGIRPAAFGADDQSRVATAADAARAGADYLVVGRPVHAAADPRAAVEALLREIGVVEELA